jgi:hypothetical protein
MRIVKMMAVTVMVFLLMINGFAVCDRISVPGTADCFSVGVGITILTGECFEGEIETPPSGEGWTCTGQTSPTVCDTVGDGMGVEGCTPGSAPWSCTRLHDVYQEDCAALSSNPTTKRFTGTHVDNADGDCPSVNMYPGGCS